MADSDGTVADGVVADGVVADGVVADEAVADDDAAGSGGGVAACPRCGLRDRVLGVTAAYLGAKSTRREETGTGDDQKVSVAEENSALAQALAPAPPAPDGENAGCWAASLLVISVGTFIWGALAGMWFERDLATRFVATGNGDGHFVVDSAYPVLGWISGATLAAGLLLLAGSALRKAIWRRRSRPGRAAADRAWSAGWYCARCGTAHFTLGPAMSLHEFRVRVWSAGGYGNKAARYPAI
ncbi:hypothetical protein OOK31_25135 [Streptomyces sp. NBC_00249]|nr:hypothetical protein [Streptomyces sp. NBC_00249]